MGFLSCCEQDYSNNDTGKPCDSRKGAYKEHYYISNRLDGSVLPEQGVLFDVGLADSHID